MMFQVKMCHKEQRLHSEPGLLGQQEPNSAIIRTAQVHRASSECKVLSFYGADMKWSGAICILRELLQMWRKDIIASSFQLTPYTN